MEVVRGGVLEGSVRGLAAGAGHQCCKQRSAAVTVGLLGTVTWPFPAGHKWSSCHACRPSLACPVSGITSRHLPSGRPLATHHSQFNPHTSPPGHLELDRVLLHPQAGHRRS